MGGGEGTARSPVSYRTVRILYVQERPRLPLTTPAVRTQKLPPFPIEDGHPFSTYPTRPPIGRPRAWNRKVVDAFKGIADALPLLERSGLPPWLAAALEVQRRV